jgi:transposase-like protein
MRNYRAGLRAEHTSKWDVDTIRAEYQAGATISELCRRYGMSWKTGKKIVSDLEGRTFRPRGNTAGLDPEALKAEVAAGTSVHALARRHGVDRRTILRRVGYEK